jgi:hypothetical protein
MMLRGIFVADTAQLLMEAAEARQLATAFSDEGTVADLLNYASALESNQIGWTKAAGGAANDNGAWRFSLVCARWARIRYLSKGLLRRCTFAVSSARRRGSRRC